MLKRLQVGSIPLPEIWVSENKWDTQIARENGLPYLVKPRGWSDQKLAKAVLYNWLVKTFPHIKWNQVLGLSKQQANRLEVKQTYIPPHVRDYTPDRDDMLQPAPAITDDFAVSDGYRITRENEEDKDITPEFDDSEVPDDEQDWEAINEETSIRLSELVDIRSVDVNIEELQALGCLPEFIGDIADGIRRNIANANWMDGWNKKLACNIGRFDIDDTHAPNLMILDTSGSIPGGVASTMVTLIDTLRSQANADLIITSSQSKWYGRNEDLPSPEILARLIGGCNECTQFNHILVEKVAGRKWGNLIVFGDWDSPDDSRFQYREDYDTEKLGLAGTSFENIMPFHTTASYVPGYGKWAVPYAKHVMPVNTGWTEVMTR